MKEMREYKQETNELTNSIINNKQLIKILYIRNIIIFFLISYIIIIYMNQFNYIFHANFTNPNSNDVPSNNPRPTKWTKLTQKQIYNITLKNDIIYVYTHDNFHNRDTYMYGHLTNYITWPPLSKSLNNPKSRKYRITHYSNVKNSPLIKNYGPECCFYLSDNMQYAEMIQFGSGVYILSWNAGNLEPVQKNT